MDEVIVRRVVVNGQVGWLKAENPNYPSIELKEGLDYAILALVRHQVHNVCRLRTRFRPWPSQP